MNIEKFSEKKIKTKKGKIYCRISGEGNPLLLLHGYPQTHLMWRKTAPALSKNFTVILADLRGYGASTAPPSDKKHLTYSKREMAKDMIQVMDHLNYETFFVAGHDRGGRVAHRMARDYRKRVKAMSVIDICPTLDMYESTNMEFARNYFHWFFLIQSKNLPEKMIENNPQAWIKQCLNRWSKGEEFGKIEEAYLKAFMKPNHIHASCEDYRAAATIDLEHDREDRKKILEIPIQILWGKKNAIWKFIPPLKIWQKYSKLKVSGKGINSGHFIPEEKPEETINELNNFFLSL